MSRTVTGPFLFSLARAPRSNFVWPKNAATPQKSSWVHFSWYGCLWHSAHWICTPMNRLPTAPASFGGDGCLLSWFVAMKNVSGALPSSPWAHTISVTIASHFAPSLKRPASSR